MGHEMKHESVSAAAARRINPPTMCDALDHQARSIPHEPFLICGNDTISFSQMRDRVLAIAAGLLAKGILVGDRVAMLSINRTELVELALATPYVGMVNIPLNVHLKGDFLRHQLTNSAATAIAVDSAGLRELQPILDTLPALRLIILLDTDLRVSDFHGATCPYPDLRAEGGPPAPHPITRLDVYQILYTSGTSGPSKGCVMSHASRIRVGTSVRDILEVVDTDIQLGVMPLFHMSGQMNLVLALLTGTPLVLEATYSASGLLPRARQVGATIVAGVFTTAELLLHQPELPSDRDHPIRAWLAIPMPIASQDKFTARFGIPVVGEMYACTEAMPVATYTLADKDRDRSTGGRILPDIDVQIVDDLDEPVSVGEVGEILLRPKTPGAIFSGYWNDAERTLEDWRNLWHHTGDLGRIDQRGLLTFIDRKKDSMRRKGENISSHELEKALLLYRAVGEVAVHAVRPAGLHEDEIKVCIVVKAGAVFDTAEFARFANLTLPYFAVPRYLELMDALPRNPIGRVQKFELRERALTTQTIDMLEAGLISDRRKPVGSPESR
jgi:carnitine-CoA ligase